MTTKLNWIAVRTAAALMLAAPVLQGCVYDTDNENGDDRVWVQAAAKTKAELGYDRGKRIAALLEQCSDPAATAEANAAKADVENAGGALINLVNMHPAQFGGAGGWHAEENKRLDTFASAQARAYNAAVACGLVEPGYPNPGSWNATWTDFSS